MSETKKLLYLPGLIDVHTHLREPGVSSKETFNTGTQAAIAGGFTMILDMPNNPIPTLSIEALQEKNRLACGKIWCDVGFNFGATINSCKEFNLAKDRVIAYKIYMNQTTGDILVDDPS